MKHIFAFEKGTSPPPNQRLIDSLITDLTAYEERLTADFALIEPPLAVTWTTPELAMTVFDSSPVPAYTRNEAIFFSPERTFWLQVFKEQQGPEVDPAIQHYYETHFYEQMREILCHELTHHIDLFPGDFDDYDQSDIWVEEGTAFYIPRKILLDPVDYQELYEVERTIAKKLHPLYGQHSVTRFGQDTYTQTLDAIMFEYMRSFLLVDFLIHAHFDGQVHAFLSAYQTFFPQRHTTSFEDYFHVDLTALWEQIIAE